MSIRRSNTKKQRSHHSQRICEAPRKVARVALAFGVCLLASGFAASVSAGPTELISVRPADNLAAGASYVGVNAAGALSSTGRFVVFNSEASDLVAADTNGVEDVFVRDRQTGVTERVSVSSSGVQAERDSRWPAISADGRFGKLWVAGSESGAERYQRRHRHISRHFCSGPSRRHDHASKRQFERGSGQYQQQRRRGRIPVYQRRRPVCGLLCVSFTNLVPNDSNNVTDIFVADHRQTGATSRVSVASNRAQANGESCASKTAVSATGRFVAFESDATNLVPADTNRAADIFVHDRKTGKTERVSTATSGNRLMIAARRL